MHRRHDHWFTIWWTFMESWAHFIHSGKHLVYNLYIFIYTIQIRILVIIRNTRMKIERIKSIKVLLRGRVSIVYTFKWIYTRLLNSQFWYFIILYYNILTTILATIYLLFPNAITQYIFKILYNHIYSSIF